MNLNEKHEETKKQYDAVVAKLNQLDAEKQKLLGEGIKLEGRLQLLEEQLLEGQMKPVEVAQTDQKV